MDIKFSPPDITDLEIESVVSVLKSGWITTGVKTKQFEKEISIYCNTSKSVCLSSATAALELTLRVLGIGPGDEVITSAYTYTATASVIDHVGAKIVLVDTAKNSFEMDPFKLENAITDRTKAVIPVDFAGVINNIENITEIVNRKSFMFKPKNDFQKAIGRIIILADGAHSFGAVRNGKHSGEIADFTCFSFHAVKNVTTAEGGAVTWRREIGIDDEVLYKQFMLHSLHGQTVDAHKKTILGSWEYDIELTGYKNNMTDIMAAIGLAQMQRIDKFLSRRKEITALYDSGFKGTAITPLKHFGDGFSSSAHLYVIRINGIRLEFRNSLIKYLAEQGIPANVHYKPLPMFTAYKNLGFDIKDFPNAYAQYSNVLSLPCHTLLANDEIEYIVHTINDLIMRGLEWQKAAVH